MKEKIKNFLSDTVFLISAIGIFVVGVLWVLCEGAWEKAKEYFKKVVNKVGK